MKKIAIGLFTFLPTADVTYPHARKSHVFNKPLLVNSDTKKKKKLDCTFFIEDFCSVLYCLALFCNCGIGCSCPPLAVNCLCLLYSHEVMASNWMGQLITVFLIQEGRYCREILTRLHCIGVVFHGSGFFFVECEKRRYWLW